MIKIQKNEVLISEMDLNSVVGGVLVYRVLRNSL